MHKKILIVDDDTSISDALATLLREEGYLVHNTSDSEEGARLIEKNKYDTGIFDYKMKGLSGIDLLKKMKNKNPRSSVFIMSGILDIDTFRADKNIVSLAAHVINKPFDIKALLQKL